MNTIETIRVDCPLDIHLDSTDAYRRSLEHSWEQYWLCNGPFDDLAVVFVGGERLTKKVRIALS